VYLDKGCTLKDAEEVASNMEYTTLENLVLHKSSKKPDFVKMYEELLIGDLDEDEKSYSNNEGVKWNCIKLDIPKCIYKGLTLDNIVNEIEKHHIEVIATDDNSEEWLLWINDKLPSIHLCGIKNIEKVIMREESINKSNDETEWILDTDGTNLQEVLSYDGVDNTKTFSNDIVEIKDVLGIEASRMSLLNELRYVISFDGTYINYRHLALLVDAMTYKGVLIPITRHGINRMEGVSPFHRCSFEETVDILMDSAIHSEKDTLNGITSNILLGKIAPCGTGAFDLISDNVIEKQNHPNTSVKMRKFDDINENPDSFMPIEEDEIDAFMPSEEKCLSFNYIPSSPRFSSNKVTLSFNYIPSSPNLKGIKQIQFGYIPSSPTFTIYNYYRPSSPTFTL